MKRGVHSAAVNTEQERVPDQSGRGVDVRVRAAGGLRGRCYFDASKVILSRGLH
jgi:hypothetical protein